jgi:hypothetical protein
VQLDRKVWTLATQQPAKRGDRIRVNYKYRVDHSQAQLELIPQNNGSS